MVFQKRSLPEMESCGHQVTAMPHVPKSARGKRSVRKKENPMCAFDLLATVAGKLLTEGENSLENISSAPALIKSAKDGVVKQEQFDDEVKPFKADIMDQDSCNESTLVPNDAFQRQANHLAMKEDPQAAPLGAASVPAAFAKTDALDKESSMISCAKADLGAIADRWSPESVESAHTRGDATKMHSAVGFAKSAPDMYSMLDPMVVDVKPPPLVSSDSSGEMPLYSDHIRRSSSFPRGRKGGMEPVVDRDDDDDNSSGCTHPTTTTNRAFRPNCTADRPVKKSLLCKYRKVPPARMHKGDLSYSDIERKPAFRSKKLYYTRQRTQRSTFKRRKLLDRHSVLSSEEGFAKSNTNGNIKVAARDPHAASLAANKANAAMPLPKSSSESKDYHVKFSIKSFKVPELLIEIPETATVGSLKRTVLEAVNAILGGGLRVGVLHHGKKVRDDSKTLQQAGIAHDDMLTNVGFSLEPNCTQAPAQVPEPEDSELLETVNTAEPLARIPPADISSKLGEFDASQELALTPMATNCHESDHDSVHSPADISSSDKTSTNSRAIVPVPAVDADAMAVVPLHKTKRSEQGQRRIRRPFSVSEVEALVQAVEKLGTGRWRDVKLRAFDNAKHRTYVDLKDKWKTLVHTASISPQQRRGEPVPQELLDRVLSAQAYWSQQQAKLQPKSTPAAEACLLAT